MSATTPQTQKDSLSRELDKEATEAAVDKVESALTAAGIELNVKVLRALIRRLQKRLGLGEPPRIWCTVRGGPNSNNFHNEFRVTYDPYGYPEFRSGFTVHYLGTHQYCHAHINSLKYRSGQQRDSFNIGGLIQFKMPGERQAQIRHFTGHYSTKSNQGSFRIYTAPVDLKDYRKPSDFEGPKVKKSKPTKPSAKQKKKEVL